MTAWDIYWLTRLEPMGHLLHMTGGALLFVGGAGAFLMGMCRGNTPRQNEDSAATVTAGVNLGVKIFVGASLLSFSSCTASKLTPSKTDLAIIFAGAFALNSDGVKRLPENVVGAMNKFIDDYRGEKK